MKHLLKHFKDLSIQPKNAAELKGLILQLAVQGKLTANWRLENHDVEPASVLLERIQAEKIQLIKEKKIKKDNPLSKITTDEIPYELPESWIWCRLGHSGYTQTGSTPPKNNIANYGDFIPFLGPADISNDWMKYPVDGLSELGISNGRLIPKKSLMMVCIGGSIGKCNVNEIDVSCNQQINTVTSLFMPIEFVKLTCQSPYFQKFVLDKSSGSATPIINKGKWEMLPIPLPPLEEQKAIVEVVNQLFAEVEQLEALTKERIQLKEDFVASALQQLTNSKHEEINGEWAFLQQHFRTFFTEQTNIKKLRESILQLAVQGKLTTHWRKENPDLEDASVLLKRIKAEKAQLIKEGKIKKEKPLSKITTDEIPYELPDGWAWCRFQEVFDIRDGTHDSPKDYQGENSYPLVTSKDFKNGEIDFSGARRISENDYNEIIKRSVVEENDILFSMIGGNIGNQIMVKGKTDFAIKNVALFKYYNQSFTIPDFLKIFSNHIAFSLQNKAIGGAQPFVSLTYLRLMLFPLPSTLEQKAIVEKVNTLMALCDQLEQEIQTSKATQEDWMKSSLREVFVVKY